MDLMKAYPKLKEKDVKRFWDKVDKNGPIPDQSNPHYAGLGNCWMWTAGKDTHGYGNFQMIDKILLSHRVAWILTKGSIPEGSGPHGTCIMHRCDQRACCNPAHLQSGSNRDNVLDKIAKGRDRSPYGDSHGMSKLTSEKAACIRNIYAEGGITQETLGAIFGVDRSVIGRIVNNRLWVTKTDK
jgi:hypothetical protein